VLFIVFVCFGREIRVAHRFLFWEGDLCCSSFFFLGGRSVLLNVFCFGRDIRVAYRFFLFWEGDPCCSLFFALEGGSVLLIVFCFGGETRIPLPKQKND
jgi:hypothetical protein